MTTAAVRSVRLGETGIETTAIGFGCADLFREPGSARRRRLLEAAYDEGIRHFDAAPMYGLGLVEEELGRFSVGKRGTLIIATKFGIEPAAAGRLIARAQAPIQYVVRKITATASPSRPAAVDPRAGAIGALLYAPVDYSVRAARASLERSLRRLGTDYIDLLFLHDPPPGAMIADDIAAFLEASRAAGRIRAWGVAGESASSMDVARRLTAPVPVLQVRGDLFSRCEPSFPRDADALLLYGVIARPLGRIVAHVRSSAEVRRRWLEAVGADCSRPDEVANLLLADALRANRHGTVLFSTTRAERIRTAAQVERTASPAVDTFISLVKSEVAQS